MYNWLVKKVFLLLLLFLLVFLGLRWFSFAQRNSQPLPQAKVAATIFPLYDLVRQVAGDKVEAVLILTPGASPHTFDATFEDAKNLSGASAVFAIGHSLDDWVLPLAQNASVSEVVVVDKNITLHKEQGVVNPHYWLTIPNALRMIDQIVDELSNLYPNQASDFRSNAQSYKLQLFALDQEIRPQIENLNQKTIATFHNAWGYFADEYGLQIEAVFEEFPGKEPSPSYLTEFQNQIKTYQIETIFAEPQFSTTWLLPLAQDLDIKVAVLDPLGGTSGQSSFLELMRYNARRIVESQLR